MQGIFPRELKVTKIIPIFKSSDTKLTSSYRPISLLNYFSKKYRKNSFCFQNKNFLVCICLLSECHCGFRPELSTEKAINYMLQKVYDAFDPRDYAFL